MSTKNTIKLKVLKDYPSVDGMLHKDDIVLLDKAYENYANSPEKIKVRDMMGRLYIIEGIYLKRIKQGD
jgi:hypothetical protein